MKNKNEKKKKILIAILIVLIGGILFMAFGDKQMIQKLLPHFEKGFVSAQLLSNSLSLGDFGFNGMNITGFKINDNYITSTSVNTSSIQFDSGLAKINSQGLKQVLSFKNNLAVSISSINASVVIQINPNNVTWNGTNYLLKDIPVKFGFWNITTPDGKITNNIAAPNIFFLDNKRINYKDFALLGGYALAYSNNSNYYVELVIPFSISSLSSFVIDPTYFNQTDGFSVSAGGASILGLAMNGSDFWIMGESKEFVFHYNKTYSNMSDGFPINYTGVGSGGALTSAVSYALTVNNSDYWVADNGINYVFHFNNSERNETVGIPGFPLPLGGATTPDGMTTNVTRGGKMTDMWIIDDALDWLFHYNVTGSNLGNPGNFSLQTCRGSGSNIGVGVVYNKSDFWTTDSAGVVCHFTSTGTNITDGFPTTQWGIGTPWGFATNITSGTPTDFWILDAADLFVYHISIANATNDTMPPIFNITNQYLLWNFPLNYSVQAIDKGELGNPIGLANFTINWTTNFTINMGTGWLTNSTPIAVGNHYINISVNDTNGNKNSTVLLINVNDTVNRTYYLLDSNVGGRRNIFNITFPPAGRIANMSTRSFNATAGTSRTFNWTLYEAYNQNVNISSATLLVATIYCNRTYQTTQFNNLVGNITSVVWYDCGTNQNCTSGTGIAICTNNSLSQPSGSNINGNCNSTTITSRNVTCRLDSNYAFTTGEYLGLGISIFARNTSMAILYNSSTLVPTRFNLTEKLLGFVSAPPPSQCSPTIDANWVISDAQKCDNRSEVTTGTGSIIITSTGSLTIANISNVTCSGLNISKSGDRVFVLNGSQLRIR